MSEEKRFDKEVELRMFYLTSYEPDCHVRFSSETEGPVLSRRRPISKVTSPSLSLRSGRRLGRLLTLDPNAQDLDTRIHRVGPCAQ